jgi:lysozyme
MDNSLFDVLTDQLRRYEGLMLRIYRDTQGYLTIGYGRNLETTGISKTEAEILLSNDATKSINEAKTAVENFDSLSINRQSVIANMIFNLGLNSFLNFKKMISYIENNQFTQAAEEMLNSLWASQVGQRAKDLAELMDKG